MFVFVAGHTGADTIQGFSNHDLIRLLDLGGALDSFVRVLEASLTAGDLIF